MCHKPENTLHLLPFKLKTPELRKTCKKLLGRLHGYNNKDEFDRITKFMTSGNNIKVQTKVSSKKEISLRENFAFFMKKNFCNNFA